jgi:hypothetical protein
LNAVLPNPGQASQPERRILVPRASHAARFETDLPSAFVIRE